MDSMKLGFGGKSPEELGRGGQLPEPGTYHCVVMQIDATFRDVDNGVTGKFEIVDGTVPGQEGKEIRFFQFVDRSNLDPSKWYMERLSRVAWACGILDGDGDVDFRKADGKDVIVKVVAGSYKPKDGGPEKKTVEIDWGDGGLWPVGHEEVSDVPTKLAPEKPVRVASSQEGGDAPPAADEADPFAGI